MTRYTDENGKLTFDAGTVERLTAIADGITSGKLKTITLPHMSRDEAREYFTGEVSPALQRKIDEANRV